MKRWMSQITTWGCLGILLAGLPFQGPAQTGLAQTTPHPATTAASVPLQAAAKAEPGQSLTLTMKDFNDPDGYTLKTVRTMRRYDFTRPTGWKVLPATAIHLMFQHSPALLPERSSLNILVNNRILKTIPLSKDNVVASPVTIPIPPNLLKDRNTLEFQVDQHYTYQCEDPFSAELWTTILPETKLTLAYAPQPIQPDLARFPYPIFDELGYGPTSVGYVAPSSLSDESFTALGAVAAGLGQRVGWRPMKPFWAGVEGLERNDHLIVVGTPSENPAISSLRGVLGKSLQGNQLYDSSGRALGENEGFLAIVANPVHPSKAILVVSGNSPKGVQAAARLLVQNPPNRLLVGPTAVVKEQSAGPTHPYRAWEGFVQHSGTSLKELGLKTLTARGITSLPLFYNLNIMPDIFLPGQTKAQLKTVYSYSSQLDVTQSKLEVLLNGKPLKNAAFRPDGGDKDSKDGKNTHATKLDDKNGMNLAELTLDIPAEELHTFNQLEYKFHLYPEKYDLCNFVTDVHIWGTVHNSSIIQIPGEVKSPLPDLGLLNDAGFPFTGYQDLSQVGFVLPKDPKSAELDTMVQVASRLGRLSSSKTGINLTVNHDGSLPDDVKKNSHLLVIGTEENNSLFKEMKGKLHLLVSGDTKSLKGPDAENAAKLAEVSYSPSQGVLEELISPWNDKRVGLLLFGETDGALKLIGKLFQNDEMFAKIEPGNLMVVNPEGPKSMIVLQKGEARFLYPQDLKTQEMIPGWAWIAVAFLAVLGLFSILRFLFGR